MSKLEITISDDLNKITPNITKLDFTSEFDSPTDWECVRLIDSPIDSPIAGPSACPTDRECVSPIGSPIVRDLANRDIVLPKSLTHLTFGTNFNQKIEENVLPKSLTHLTFGGDYNQKIEENVLPKSLTHLTFGFYYSE
ncbi:hypothetical protein crov001 [Cafeteria roenbergensis virus]|uniref:FNIP repeat-containing protein n=1 Tax=Cafeteria roenbergensis virus (strain BV-PW1) TaxID=693272 RepID=E3T4C1_CROVB|nr:hypothetical protein crov001 [Cafeteria roenbergensis virus BV-PW1]ADO67034.1 hypothetical protein crov001 [Cafeteria roenbergensis virus BV-PW1]